MVVPVPLHWRRRYQRGFNQADLLARLVARQRRIPSSIVLRRTRATLSQAGLSHAGRRRNMSGAFACRRPGLVKGRRVLLIDDVMTTGSTAAACALALKRAGASRVVFLTVARVDRRFAAPETTYSNLGGAV